MVDDVKSHLASGGSEAPLPTPSYPKGAPRSNDQDKKEEEAQRHILPREKPFVYRHTLVDGIVFPSMIDQSHVDYVRERFPFRDGDVFLATYPKSGTTWSQAIIKMLMGFGDDAKVVEAVPWLEVGGSEESEAVGFAERLPTGKPRCFKTHAPWPCVAKSRTDENGNEVRLRYLFVARNPKDVCVSLYHHSRGFRSFCYEGDFDHFFNMFLHGEVESGSWLDFNKGYLEASKRNPKDFLLLTYEDMHRCPLDNVLRIAQFLGITCSEERANEIVNKTCFRELKNDPTSNYSWAKHRRNEGEAEFMRKGEVGDWKNYLSEEQEQLIEEQMLCAAREAGLNIPDTL